MKFWDGTIQFIMEINLKMVAYGECRQRLSGKWVEKITSLPQYGLYLKSALGYIGIDICQNSLSGWPVHFLLCNFIKP